VFKYGKGTYTMLLSVADRGETIKDERERERERKRVREKGSNIRNSAMCGKIVFIVNTLAVIS